MRPRVIVLIKFLVLTSKFGFLRGTLRQKISQLASENNTSTFDYLYDLKKLKIIDQATCDYILSLKLD